ncbi:hypothetical protein B0H63DRAFT_468466 [Podospora didyma]|uniref:Rhodopsin domain-containing protein n=1 Tax=Podospora didyma TaxID=330526 RepID=A0AAE0NST7_9PEZI|nr:hypothetical protein B0H63DRAFT_468466 [Podospora didyma]
MADPNAPPPSAEYIAENKGPSIDAVICTVVALSTLFVCARIFVRGYLMRKLQIDDYIIIVSMLCAWTCVGISLEAVRWGNGRHFDTLNLDQMQNAVKWTIFGFPAGIMSFSLPKFAVVALLTRLLNPSRMHRIFLWSMVGLCQIVLGGCIVILFAQCTPSASQWDFSITGAKCWDKWLLVKYSMVAGGFSAFTDLYLAIYPTVVLFKLHLELKKKIALCIALGIGSISTVVAIYKTTRIPSLASPDFSWDTSDLVIWTIVEGSTIIIASCIPLLQPLVDFASGRRYTNPSKSGGYKHYGSSADGKLQSDLELESSRRAPGRRLKPIDPDHDLMHTVVDKGSQESILPPKQGDIESNSSNSAVNYSEPSKNPHPNISGGGRPPAGNIVRTQEITVEYGADGTTVPGNRTQWGAF